MVPTLSHLQLSLNFQHRDIKPSNILKIGDQWVLSDFGVSKIIDPEAWKREESAKEFNENDEQLGNNNSKSVI